MSFLDSLVARSLPFTPRFVVGRVARRYIAGETIEDAIATIRSLNTLGAETTVDVLGEFIHEFSEAEETAREYRRALDAISVNKLRSNVSIKLTAFGLGLDRERCIVLVRSLARAAGDLGLFVRIDMENSPYTDATLAIARQLRGEGLPVGVVIQAYLRRTEADARALAAEGMPVRLCKGIYRESPEIAFQAREEIRESYRRSLRALFAGPARVAIATHDEPLVTYAKGLLEELGVPRERYEFQMLLGVRERLRDEILAAGQPLRIYVPYGRSWYGYSLRRLRENPAIAGHVLRATFGAR